MTEHAKTDRPVETAIRATIHEGDCLNTPSKGQPFWVAKISGDGIALELGEQRTLTRFTWACLEGALPFLAKHGKVRIIGRGMSTEIVPGTLDAYLRGCVHRYTASYIAALLEKAGIVAIDTTRPASVTARVSQSLP